MEQKLYEQILAGVVSLDSVVDQHTKNSLVEATDLQNMGKLARVFKKLFKDDFHNWGEDNSFVFKASNSKVKKMLDKANVKYKKIAFDWGKGTKDTYYVLWAEIYKKYDKLLGSINENIEEALDNKENKE